MYMKGMRGIFLYSYPQLNWQKCFVFFIRLCLFFKKLVMKAEQDLPGTAGGGGRVK
jgi:hypothetical protein